MIIIGIFRAVKTLFSKIILADVTAEIWRILRLQTPTYEMLLV